jgi:signal transduction histidine kinase
MRERAEELGGEFTVLPGRPGLHIRASLPLQKE